MWTSSAIIPWHQAIFVARGLAAEERPRRAAAPSNLIHAGGGGGNGWLLNELVRSFDDAARPTKRRVNQGAIGSLPPQLRVALLAGVAVVAADPAAVIGHLRPACRPIYHARFDELAATAAGRSLLSQINS